MGSLYKKSLGSMFETPIIAAAREIRDRKIKDQKLSERELDLKEKELALKEKEIELELMKLKKKSEDQNIINGLIYD